MNVWHIFADGREFGIDYVNRADAERVVASFKASFPRVRYVIRRAQADA